jgi:nucleoside-triphosphatase
MADPPNLLLTGPSKVGKTTVLRRVAEGLAGRRIRGFLSDEIRVAGRREGFRLEGFHGEFGVLASPTVRSPHRFGRYRVDVEALDRIVEATLLGPDRPDVYLIDEIGPMGCLSGRFIEAVRRLLDGDVPVVATVHVRAGGFVAETKARPDVEVWEVTRANRDASPARVVEWAATRLRRP